jgi:hypothetical protein
MVGTCVSMGETVMIKGELQFKMPNPVPEGKQFRVFCSLFMIDISLFYDY